MYTFYVYDSLGNLIAGFPSRRDALAFISMHGRFDWTIK